MTVIRPGGALGHPEHLVQDEIENIGEQRRQQNRVDKQSRSHTNLN
jgi:hypothetical protein